MTGRGVIAAVLAAGIVAVVGGCGRYQLVGKVVEGSEGASSGMAVVTRSDGRLRGPAVADARLRLTFEPDNPIDQQVVAEGRVREDGWFAIPIDIFGAGMLEHEFELLVRADGYNSAVGTFRLPGGERRMLVVLARGEDQYSEPDDIEGESLRYLELVR